MRERVYRTEALILRRNDFNEADRLLLLATPNGKRRLIAKGVRKTTSRLAGSLELFTHTNMLAATGRNLDIITQSQTIQGFSTLRAELPRLSCAYYITELYDKFTIEEAEENRQLFALLIQTFTALETTANLDLVLRAYELRLLHQSGYRPHLHRCAASHELLTEEANRFSPTLGGALDPRYAHADRNALPMSLNAFKLLRYLQTLEDQPGKPYAGLERLRISTSLHKEVAELLRSYIRTLLERELKTVAFLEDVMRDV